MTYFVPREAAQISREPIVCIRGKYARTRGTEEVGQCGAFHTANGDRPGFSPPPRIVAGFGVSRDLRRPLELLLVSVSY